MIYDVEIRSVIIKEKNNKESCGFVFINEAVVPTIICEGGLCETEYFRAKAEFLSESQKVNKKSFK